MGRARAMLGADVRHGRRGDGTGERGDRRRAARDGGDEGRVVGLPWRWAAAAPGLAEHGPCQPRAAARARRSRHGGGPDHAIACEHGVERGAGLDREAPATPPDRGHAVRGVGVKPHRRRFALAGEDGAVTVVVR